MEKNKEIIISMKACTDYVLSIYKLLDTVPKMPNQISDLYEYTHNLEKMLKKLVPVIHKNLLIKQTTDKLEEQIRNIQNTNDKLVRQNKDYKCELDVLQKQMKQAQQTYKILQRKLRNSEKVSENFQMKVNQLKKQAEDGLRKIIQSKRQTTNFNERKKSLPIISSYQKRQKLGLLLLMDSPQRSDRNNRLVEHLRKKY